MAKNDMPITSERDVRIMSDLENIDWSAVLGKPVSVVRESGREEVGTDFEPRVQVNYEFIMGDGSTLRNTALLVLEKDDRSVSCAYLRYTKA